MCFGYLSGINHLFFKKKKKKKNTWTFKVINHQEYAKRSHWEFYLLVLFPLSKGIVVEPLNVDSTMENLLTKTEQPRSEEPKKGTYFRFMICISIAKFCDIKCTYSVRSNNFLGCASVKCMRRRSNSIIIFLSFPSPYPDLRWEIIYVVGLGGPLIQWFIHFLSCRRGAMLIMRFSKS